MRAPAPSCDEELPGEPRRPRAVILAELKELLDLHAPGWAWAQERLVELMAPRRMRQMEFPW